MARPKKGPKAGCNQPVLGSWAAAAAHRMSDIVCTIHLIPHLDIVKSVWLLALFIYSAC